MYGNQMGICFISFWTGHPLIGVVVDVVLCHVTWFLLQILWTVIKQVADTLLSFDLIYSRILSTHTVIITNFASIVSLADLKGVFPA